MAGLVIPNVLKDANVYINGVDFLGKGEVKLPDVEQVTVEHQAMGISGKVELPLPGMVSKMEGSIKFKSFNEDAMKVVYNSGTAFHISVFASVQAYDPSTGVMDEFQVKAVLRAFFKKVSMPDIKQAQDEGAEVSYSANYYKLTVNGEDVVEVDPINYIYQVGGVDLLEKTRANLGMK